MANMTIAATDASTEAWMLAVESRDARFDGWVTIGVTSTGIYCRPSCPTPIRPKRSNMRFFATPASAQAAGFRACKRCAPDATPGSPEWNRRDDLVARAIRGIEDGVIDRHSVEGLASQLAVSSRHLNRLLVSQVGATPIQLARARRARAARVLIEGTVMPFSDIAFAAGFDSIRQFNDTVREVFAASPTELRRSRRKTGSAKQELMAGDWLCVRLPFRPPLDVRTLWAWLDAHSVPGIEEVDGSVYRRSLRLESGPGVVELVAPQPDDSAIEARFLLTSLSDLQQAIQRCRRLLDLDADPLVIRADLGRHQALVPLLNSRPGVRAPGDVDGIDSAIRAVLHQQVSLASGRGVCARLIQGHGEPLSASVGEVGSLTRVFPTAATWAGLDSAKLGLPKSRAKALVAVAQAVACGDLDLSPAADREEAKAKLCAIKGIGPWTATIVALRALHGPDEFSSGDLALRRAADTVGLPSGAEELQMAAEQWRPWRSYVMHHLWAEYAAPTVRSESAAPRVRTRTMKGRTR